MKPEAIRKYYIENGNIKNIDNLSIFNKIQNPPIYEVIRVINGVPLFLEDHLNRMFQSSKIIGYDMEITENQIRKDIKKLILENNIDKLNIKLLSTEVEDIGKIFLVYCIESFYPPERFYKKGIHTILFKYERKNPNAKVLFTSFKEGVTKELDDKEAFEALLVDKSGYIPEGSRSNIFFIKNSKVYTAPKSDVLLGITRMNIFKICEKIGVEIIEKSIHEDEINQLDGAFMSGTSVNILPISTINNIKINSVNNSIINKINESYIQEMKNYISKYKKDWI